MRLLIPILLLQFFAGPNRSYGQIITTFAGNRTFGYSGDGGPAIAAQLGDLYQTGVATDNNGNTYIVMAGNASVIRKVDPAGIISTIAGTGTFGYTGDGGPATSARLYHPSGIVVDNAGNIIFADQNGAVLRRITPAGIISTICAPYTGACTGDGGPLANARFNSISGLSRDNAGNIYVADQACHVVRKISTSGIITNVAGNGTFGSSGNGGPATSAQLGQPFQVGVDNAGNIYIPDGTLNNVRKVNSAGIIDNFAGTGVQGFTGDGGPALSATFRGPTSICIDNNQNIYIADYYNAVVRKVDVLTNIISSYAGTGITPGYSGDGGPATAATMTEPSNVSFDNLGNLYIVDYHNYVIRKVNNCLTSVITNQPVNYSLCGSGNASFSVTANNVTSYQWQVNTGTGWSNVVDGSVYAGATTGLLTITGATGTMHNYQYRCILSNSCGPVFTTTVTLTVSTPSTPTIVINTASTSICQGINANFTSSIQYGGSNPVYQWKKNGLAVGTNSSIYSDISLANGDVITCEIISNAGCVTTATASSNPITMTVTPVLTPTITIAASDNNICYGTPVTFTSFVNNEGTTPNYTWFKNSVNLFINAPTYTDNALNNGDIIMGVLSSSLSCISSAVVPSAPVTMIVTTPVTPTVAISASPATVCRNSAITFTATETYGGTSPSFVWTKNGSPVGNNSNIYTETTPVNGDIIRCTMNSTISCVTNSQATSSPVIVSVHPDPIVNLDQSNSICEGGQKTLDAGSFNSYLWSNGAVSRSITVNSVGTYSVTVTDQNGCKGTGTSQITTILPAPRNFLGGDTAVCSYGSIVLLAPSNYSSYQWNNGSSALSLTVTQPGEYWLQVTDGNSCSGKDFITVKQKHCLKGLFVPSGFTPNNDGKNDILRPFLGGNVTQYKFSVYNRYGQVVFETSDISKGWDGRFRGSTQDSHVFVWTCFYQFEGEDARFEKGTVVLIK